MSSARAPPSVVVAVVPGAASTGAEATTEATRIRISKVEGSTASDMVNRRTCSATATSGPRRNASATDSGAFSCSQTSNSGALASNSNNGLVTAAEEERRRWAADGLIESRWCAIDSRRVAIDWRRAIVRRRVTSGGGTRCASFPGCISIASNAGFL